MDEIWPLIWVRTIKYSWDSSGLRADSHDVILFHEAPFSEYVNAKGTSIPIMNSFLGKRAVIEGGSEIFGRSIWDDGRTPAMLLDVDGRIIDLNPPMVAGFGRPLAELKGAMVWDYFAPDDCIKRRETLRRLVESREPQSFLSTRHGRWFDSVLRPCLGPDGEVLGAALLAVETTEEHLAKKALEQSERRLRFTLESTGVGLWEVDWASGKAWRSPEHARIFGCDDNSQPWAHAEFLRHVLDEDRPRVERTIQAGLAAGKGWSFECRICRQDGEERWIWVNCVLILTEDGQPQRDQWRCHRHHGETPSRRTHQGERTPVYDHFPV